MIKSLAIKIPFFSIKMVFEQNRMNLKDYKKLKNESEIRDKEIFYEREKIKECLISNNKLKKEFTEEDLNFIAYIGALGNFDGKELLTFLFLLKSIDDKHPAKIHFFSQIEKSDNVVLHVKEIRSFMRKVNSKKIYLGGNLYNLSD